MSDNQTDEQPKGQSEPEIVSTFATRKSRKKQPPYGSILIGGVAVVIVGAAGFYVLRDAKAEVGSVIVEGDGVNCRAGPGLTDLSLTKFDQGTSLRVLKIEGGWYQVEHSPEPCWVTATLVSFTPAETAEPEQRGSEVFQLQDEIDPMSDARVVSAVAQIETQTGGIAELTIRCTNGADLSTRFASYNAPSDNEQMSGLSLDSTLVTDYNRMQYLDQWFIDVRLDEMPAKRFACSSGQAGCRYNNMVPIDIRGYFQSEIVPRVYETVRTPDELQSRIESEIRTNMSEWRFANMTVRYSAGGMQNTIQFPMQDSAVRTVVSACLV